MPAKSPKLSAYVSQEIHDRLVQFKNERSLKSESVALGVILAEYFQVNQKVDCQSSLLSGDDFVSKKQFEDLEQKLSELPNNLFSELNRVVDEFEEKIARYRSELLDNSLSSSLKSVEIQTVNVESEPQEDSNHLQLDLIDSILDKENLENLTAKSIPEQTDFTLSEPSESLSGKILAKRLNITTSALSSKKKELSEQDFYNWLQENDPDKISWRPIGGDLKKRVSGWIPSQDTASELLGRLKEWVVANP
jgi:hypothetical protein